MGGDSTEKDHVHRECRSRGIKLSESMPLNKGLNKGPLVERLHRAELKVMTWNLADFSTGGVVQQLSLIHI